MNRLFKRNDTGGKEGETSPVVGLMRRLSNRSTSSQRSPILQHSPLQQSPLQQLTPVLQQQDQSKKRDKDTPLSAKPKFSPTNHSTKRSGVTAALTQNLPTSGCKSVALISRNVLKVVNDCCMGT